MGHSGLRFSSPEGLSLASRGQKGLPRTAPGLRHQPDLTTGKIFPHEFPMGRHIPCTSPDELQHPSPVAQEVSTLRLIPQVMRRALGGIEPDSMSCSAVLLAPTNFAG